MAYSPDSSETRKRDVDSFCAIQISKIITVSETVKSVFQENRLESK